MNFAEQLKAQSDLAVVKFADEFTETIKPRLEESAKGGYSAFRTLCGAERGRISWNGLKVWRQK